MLIFLSHSLFFISLSFFLSLSLSLSLFLSTCLPVSLSLSVCLSLSFSLFLSLSLPLSVSAHSVGARSACGNEPSSVNGLFMMASGRGRISQWGVGLTQKGCGGGQELCFRGKSPGDATKSGHDGVMPQFICVLSEASKPTANRHTHWIKRSRVEADDWESLGR